jgi:tetratricopeptide (TPR) repeat protein
VNVPAIAASVADDDEEEGGGRGRGDDVPCTSLLAAFLGKVGRHAMDAVNRIDGRSNDDPNGRDDGGMGGGDAITKLHYVFAVPDSYPTSTRNELIDAAYASSSIVDGASTIDSSQCVAAAYKRKFGNDDIDGNDGAISTAEEEKSGGRIVVVVEVGHVRCQVTVLRHGARNDGIQTNGDGEGNIVVEGKDDDVVNGSNVEVLSSASSSNLGGFLVDVALHAHFLSTHPSLRSPAPIPLDSRRSQRLLSGCTKLKHVLSMLPEGTVTVENIGKDDTDVDLHMTRELMESLCRTSVSDKLNALICDAISSSGIGGLHDIDVVEVCGGGSRVPMIRDAIRDACGKGADYVPCRSFDDSYLAFGASLIGIVDSSSGGGNDDGGIDIDDDRASRRSRLREAEAAMLDRDATMIRRAEFRNGIEARVLELRSARGGRHGDLLPKTDDFARYLDDVDDWLYSDECDASSVEEMEGKWNDVNSSTMEMCAEYYAAEREYELGKEREMEEEARLAAAERAADVGEDGGDDDDDHDTRRLPTKRRMEIVMKNKNEANELFSDGNYRHAAARYAKALSHCAKLFDLSPAEEDEAREVRLSLYLNLAFAYIKLDKLDNAMQSCDDALKLDGASVKALYRRATVLYQKRKFDDAVRDLVEAGRLAPEDKAVKKLRGLVDQQMAKQKKKEKAMAKKMFG